MIKFKDLYNRMYGSTPIYVGDETNDECEEIYSGEKCRMPYRDLEKYGDCEVLDICLDSDGMMVQIWIVRD